MAEKKFVQREKRFSVGDLNNLEAVVCRGDSDTTVFFAELMDFSRSGLKFRLPFSARFDEKLKIRLSCKNSDLEYSGVGRVRHIRNTDVNRWIVGCSIEPVLPDEVITFLASATQQERRKNPRLDVNAIGNISRQGSIEESVAKIRNVSKGGFCLLVNEPHESGSRVNFSIDNRIGYKEKITARVRWHRKLDDGYLLGLCYADKDSYDKLLDCLDLPRVLNNPIIGSMSWKMVACAVGAMLLPSVSYLLLGANFETGRNSVSNPHRITNPFVVDIDDEESRTFASRPKFEKRVVNSRQNLKKSDDLPVLEGKATVENQPPGELRVATKTQPRRLRVRQKKDSTKQRLAGAAGQDNKSQKNIEIYSQSKKEQASTRRGNSKRKLLVPSEVIRKRLLH